MALSSMTGFARTSFEVDGAKFSWEAKSVNARGLEIRLRLPNGLDHLEADVRARIRDAIPRGSCFFTLAREAEGAGARLVVNEQALALVVAAARRLAAEEGVGMPTADGLLAIPGVLGDASTALDTGAEERLEAAVLTGLGAAMSALTKAKLEEGARLAALIADQIDRIERLVGEAEAISVEAPDLLRARIREQVALLASDNTLNPDRLHQEALLAATRADVREELDRLKSHVASASSLLKSTDPVGRRFDFLSQEFNREANTLCSKAFDRRLTTIGLDLKAVIDQLKEQVQNLT